MRRVLTMTRKLRLLEYSSSRFRTRWTGQFLDTATELIYQRADATQSNMGNTNYLENRFFKQDVEISKNNLSEDELKIHNRMVSAFLDVAEIQALNRNPMTMQNWAERLEQFLTMTDCELFTHTHTIRYEMTLQKAHDEYEAFRLSQLNEASTVETHFVEADQC